LEPGFAFLCDIEDLTYLTKLGESRDQPHRSLCRQLFNENLNNLTEDYSMIVGGFIVKGDKFYVNSAEELVEDNLKPLIERQVLHLVGSFITTLKAGWSTAPLVDEHDAFLVAKAFEKQEETNEHKILTYFYDGMYKA